MSYPNGALHSGTRLASVFKGICWKRGGLGGGGILGGVTETPDVPGNLLRPISLSETFGYHNDRLECRSGGIMRCEATEQSSRLMRVCLPIGHRPRMAWH